MESIKDWTASSMAMISLEGGKQWCGCCIFLFTHWSTPFELTKLLMACNSACSLVDDTKQTLHCMHLRNHVKKEQMTHPASVSGTDSHPLLFSFRK